MLGGTPLKQVILNLYKHNAAASIRRCVNEPTTYDHDVPIISLFNEKIRSQVSLRTMATIFPITSASRFRNCSRL
jgi:hypothetical protein